MRSTPVFSIVPHGDSAKSSALQVPSFHPFPHVNVTCLFTNPHALWGLVRVNSTPPIQELGFRHKAFPLSIDSRLARLELPNTPPHAAAFCTVFPTISLHTASRALGSTCTDLLKYHLLESQVAASCKTLSGLLSRDSYPAFPSKLSCNLLASLSPSSQEDCSHLIL